MDYLFFYFTSFFVCLPIVLNVKAAFWEANPKAKAAATMIPRPVITIFHSHRGIRNS
jgi:hypothetical protein